MVSRLLVALHLLLGPVSTKHVMGCTSSRRRAGDSVVDPDLRPLSARATKQGLACSSPCEQGSASTGLPLTPRPESRHQLAHGRLLTWRSPIEPHSARRNRRSDGPTRPRRVKHRGHHPTFPKRQSPGDHSKRPSPTYKSSDQVEYNRVERRLRSSRRMPRTARHPGEPVHSKSSHDFAAHAPAGYCDSPTACRRQ